jgi:hypothetical protein
MKGTTNADELSSLGRALAELAKGIPGNQATHMADRILERMKGTTDTDELSYLGSALSELAASFPQLLPTLADGITSLSTTFPCGVAVTHATLDQLPLLIDMLKWPTCGPTRDGVMLQIARLKDKNPADKIGAFDDPSDRSTYHANLREFIAWLKTQKDANGKPFDVDGPPIRNPLQPSSAVGPRSREHFIHEKPIAGSAVHGQRPMSATCRSPSDSASRRPILLNTSSPKVSDSYFTMSFQQLTQMPEQPHAIFIMGAGMSIRHVRVGVRRPVVFDN